MATETIRRASVAAVVALLSVCAACAWMSWSRHGLHVRWLGDNDTVIAEGLEHRVEFRTRGVPLSRYVQNWQGDPPHRMPELRAELDGFLTMQQSCDVWADGRGHAELAVGGQHGRFRLDPGTYPMHATWRGPMEPATHFAIMLRCDGEEDDRPAPRTAFSPEENPSSTTHALLAFVVLIVAYGAAFALRAHKHVTALAVVGVVLLGAGLRFHRYDIAPAFLDTEDELIAMWNGYSMLEDGRGRGWSIWWEHYPQSVERTRVAYWGSEWPELRPYFDQPPLYHLVIGAIEHLARPENYLANDYRIARVFTGLTQILTLLALMALARALDPERGPRAALLSGLLFAVIPTIVLQGRIAKEETLLALLLTTALWLFTESVRTPSRHKWFWAGAVMVSLTPLVKFVGVAFVASYALLAFKHRSPRDGIAVGVIGAAVASTWFIYGAAVNWEAFAAALRKQNDGRGTHFSVFLRWAHYALIDRVAYGWGWQLFLMASALIYPLTRTGLRARIVILPLAAFLIAITLGAGNWTFGWYLYPIFPLLALCAGNVLDDLFEQPRASLALLFWFSFVFYTFNTLVSPDWLIHHNERMKGFLYGFSIVGFAVFGAVELWPKAEAARGLARATLALGLLVALVLQANFIVRYELVAEQIKDFDRAEYFRSN